MMLKDKAAWRWTSGIAVLVLMWSGCELRDVAPREQKTEGPRLEVRETRRERPPAEPGMKVIRPFGEKPNCASSGLEPTSEQ